MDQKIIYLDNIFCELEKNISCFIKWGVLLASLMSQRVKNLGLDPCVGKIPWSRAWQPTLVFLPRESHGQKSLVGYSPWGCKRVRQD